MSKKFGKIIGKVVLSFVAFMVAIMLGDIIGRSVLGISPDPKTLSLMFVPALVFPIWYPSQIPKRLLAALVGPIVGFGFWCISLVLPVETGSEMVLVSGAIRGGAFIVALGAEFLVMRPRA